MADKTTSLWVLQITGTGEADLLDKAFEALNATEGIKVVWESYPILGLVFEKPDDMPHVIQPHLEKWGYIKGEGMRIEMKQCDKKGVGFTGGEQK